MIDKVVIVDGNNWAWAAFYAYAKLRHKGRRVSIIYGLPTMIGAILRHQKPSSIYVVWDSAHHPIRLKLNSDYKAREKKEGYEDFVRQKEVAQDMLTSLGIRQVIAPGNEADDVIYHMVKRFTGRVKRIVIASNDKDFHQLIGSKEGSHIQVYNNKYKKLFNQLNLKDQFGYDPHQTVDYLSLIGDKSDNIPGIPGIGEKKATQILQKGNLLDIHKEYEQHNWPSQFTKDALAKCIVETVPQIDLAMFYNKYLKGRIKLKHIGGRKPELDLPRFKNLTRRYGINKLTGEDFAYLTFKNNKHGKFKKD